MRKFNIAMLTAGWMKQASNETLQAIHDGPRNISLFDVKFPLFQLQMKWISFS